LTLAAKTGVTRPFGQGAAPPGGARRSADRWDYSPEAIRRSVMASLERLRVEGRIGGIGIGANTVEAPLALMTRARFDAVLVAGRYNLLDQSMSRLVPVARAAGTRLIVGGVFGSGILATGAVPGATHHYDPAPPEVLARVARIEAACRTHGVPMRAVALQFPLAHPSVSTLLIGARSPTELADCLTMLNYPVPPELWRDLRREGLIDPEAPTP
jgi:D-threo-aldose 1-dehydrogenase